MKNIKHLLPFILITYMGFSQELPQVIPPSPEAATVFKSSEVPVSLFTGVPNINVPLFEIEAKGMTIPISLNYNSRGIQVQEIASRVGLGWSLNYGGMISRQVRGLADEGGGYTYLNNNTSKPEFYSSSTIRHDVVTSYTNYPEYDFTPDQFYFNVNGLSGKFILDQNDGQPVIQEYSGMKISYTTTGTGGVNTIYRFTLTDEGGNTYYFGGSVADRDNIIQNIVVPESTSSPIFSAYNGDIQFNTWHLTDIETAQGENIHFEYEPETSNFYRRSYDALEEGSSTPTGDYKSHFSKINSEQYRIKRISFAKGKVEFQYSNTARLDLADSNTLDRVILYNKNNEEVKQYVLNYYYTTGANDGNQLWYLRDAEPEAFKRLFLESVKIKSVNNDFIPAYQFEYDPTLLPNRHSNSQDYWGYYNGRDNGSYLKFYYNTTGNRIVDTLKSEAGLLKKITYPEGGSSAFTYEHNKVINTFPSNLVFATTNPIENKGVVLSNFYYNDPTIYNGDYYEMTFTVGQNLIGDGISNVFIDDDTGCYSTGNTYECKFSVALKNLQTGITYQLLIGETTLAILDPGDYSIKVTPMDPNYNPTAMNEGFRVYIDWQEEIVSPQSFIYAGGKRIKKIDYKASSDAISYTKSYSYINPVTGGTSGYLFGLPSFYSLKKVTNNGAAAIEPYGSVPGSPLSTYQGSSLGYQTVTEYYGEGEVVKGKTVHTFSTIPDTGLYYDFPYHLPTDNEWLRGKQESITQYRKTDTAFEAVKKVENQYLYGDYLDSYGGQSSAAILTPIPVYNSLGTDMTNSNASYLKNKRMFRLPIPIYAVKDTIIDGNVVIGVSGNYYYKTYHLTGGTVNLLSQKVTDYFDSGEIMETTVQYNYDYDTHYNVDGQTTTTSTSDIVETNYSYAPDLGNQAMIDKNMIGIPLKTETFRGTEPLSSVETTYKDWGNSLLAPELVETAKGTEAMETRVRYNVMDNTNGNPLEVQKEGGMLISYIWGYNSTQPVAKIENLAYGSIPVSLITAIQSATDAAVYNEQNVLSALDALRTDPALANAMVTTYTYKPLVGVSTITDPKGNKVSYHYDSFGRLQYVKDKDGNILSETEYHYRTQN